MLSPAFFIMIRPLILVLSILFTILTFVGMYKPWIVFWWADFSNRKKVLAVYGSLALMCWLLYLLKNAHLMFCALLLLFPCSQRTPAIDTQSALNDSGFAAKVDSLIYLKMKQYEIPGLSIGITKNGQILYSRGYGIRRVGTQKMVSENTIFHTASISKLLTATAIVKLVSEGQLSLDERLADIIPKIQYDDERINRITIKDLLNHTSGLPDIEDYHWENNNQSEESLQEYVAGLYLELESAPSTTYSYSNLGYNLLGYVIEKKTKTSFEDYLEDSILNPSGMAYSDFRYFNIPDSLTTSPHTKNKVTEKIEERKVYPYTREHAASSTLNASAVELSRWMISFMNRFNRENTPSVYNLTLKPASDKFPQIGLGFQQYEFETKHAVGHYGGDRGFRSFLMMIPNEEIGLVLLANCDYNEDFRQEIVHEIARLIMGEKRKVRARKIL